MCKEYLTIAICAPAKIPSMSFTCGQLHLVAGSRQVCEKATGSCLCFVGTCGVLESIPTAKGIQMSCMKSIRCAACTSREEEVGERRSNEELIGSPLLTRVAANSPEQKMKLEAIIKDLWNNQQKCPYHAPSTISEESNAPVIISHESDMDMNKDKDAANGCPAVTTLEEVGDDNVSDRSSNATHGSNDSNMSDASRGSKKNNDGLGRKVGIQASIWATAPDKVEQRSKHAISPRVQSPVKRHQPAVSPVPKKRMALPQFAAAKSFLRVATTKN
ncbi:hypothetical protein V8C42DRAFT_358720 [Trichoderma barbatum]